MDNGESPYYVDEYLKMFVRIVRKSLYRLEKDVEVFGGIYLKKHSLNDVQQLYVTREERHGFPDMITSIISEKFSPCIEMGVFTW